MQYQFVTLLTSVWMLRSSAGWIQPNAHLRMLATTTTTTTTTTLFYATSNVRDPIVVQLPKSIEKLSPVSLDDRDNHCKANKVQVYCDLDGVLVDFAHGIKKIFDNRLPEEIPKRTMWEGVKQVDSFYETLPWTPDGKKLWKAIQPLSPDILTGVPPYINSRKEKVNWCRRELLSVVPSHRPIQVHHVDMAAHDGRDHVSVNGNEYYRPVNNHQESDVLNVITCWSQNKHYESRPGAVLIDDTLALKDAWEAAGGIFIHHQNTERTLNLLKDYGILGPGWNGDGASEQLDDESPNSYSNLQESIQWSTSPLP